MHRLLREEDGTTSIEYALIGTLVSIVILMALANIGSALQFYFTIADSIRP
ncbi:MAG: Flp family type IVb pilin [Myxococcota bacterium]